MKKLYTLLLVALLTTGSYAQVVISQVYGGGGNGGATYSNDFIELHNRGTVAVVMSGWSVQYASAAGANWSYTPIPTVTLLPGQYYLIQEAAGATPVLALPTPDLDGTTSSFTPAGVALVGGLAMSGSNGKVILENTITPETTVNPTGAQIIDKVGYGTTPLGYEGTGPTGTALTSSTSAQRNNAGCVDTDSNPTDFTTATPMPRNTSTALSNCSLSVAQNSISGLNIYPNPVTNGVLYITSDSNEAKSVVLYDILGKQVINTTVINQSVNIANLNSGIYLLKVTENGKTATRKLVIK